MAITFNYVGIETDASKLVGSNCSNPADLNGLTENWHFRITGLPIPPQNNPVYPRILTDSTGDLSDGLGDGIWFNPNALSQRTDNKCNPPTNNWPMHVVPSVSGSIVTWDIYVAPYHSPLSLNNQPLPGIDYSLQLYNNQGLVAKYSTRIPGLRFLGVVNTPHRDSWSVKSCEGDPNRIALPPDTVGTSCANPETNNVPTNWKFSLSGIPSYEGAILLTGQGSGQAWRFNVTVPSNPNPPYCLDYICDPDNTWPMGVSPNLSVPEPGTGSNTGLSPLYTWMLYVAPKPDTLPQVNSLFTVTIYNANTGQNRIVTAQIFASDLNF